jgi:hypothetical protein
MSNGMLTFGQLQKAVSAGEIDTVVVAMTDMQGRLVGKRFQAEFFVAGAHEETHACDYLLADDIDMEPVPGYAAANWAKGYGDFILKPDMATLRRIPWLEGTALVLADVLDHHHHGVPHSPRQILQKQAARLEDMGFKAFCASELEFYLFDESYESAAQKRFHGLKTAGGYIEDYHILQTTKEEGVMRAIRKGLQAAGIPVENSKGEWGPGQEEINVRYADALTMADRHVFFLPHPHVALGQGGDNAAVLRSESGVRHVRHHAQLHGGADPLREGHHVFPRALHQLLQAVPGRHIRADQDCLEPRQQDRRVPPVRRGHEGHSVRVPDRRRGPEPVSRLCRADRGGDRRVGGKAGALRAILG